MPHLTWNGPYVDYIKAFDTLDHAILFKKLMNFGLNVSVIGWCESYLNGRKQCVRVDDVVSDTASITYGVPQGSILGPLFFIMYVNDVMCLFNENFAVCRRHGHIFCG